MKNMLHRALLGLLLTWPAALFAAPPIWDANFGTDTGLQEDDGEIEVTLGFLFRFDGVDYDTLSINSNGGVTLGVGGVFAGDSYVDYDIWQDSYFESDFTDVGNAMILPFNTDLDNGDGPVGSIHFKTDANKAVVTWSGIATHENDTQPFITFQLTLAATGEITFGYDGVTADLVIDTDQGIVIGISNGAGDTPPASSDLSAAMNADLMTKTVYEIWCYTEDMATGGDCYDQTGTRPDNYGFDLDQTNVIFTPNGTGGYDLSTTATPPPPPPAPAPPLERYKISGCTMGVSDGTLDPTLPLLVLTSLAYLLLRRRREI